MRSSARAGIVVKKRDLAAPASVGGTTVFRPRGVSQMKRLPAFAAALAAAFCAAVGASFSLPAGAQTKWDLPTAYPPSNFHTENIQQFASDVDKATNGQ